MGVRGCGVLKEKKRGNFRLGAGRLWCTVIVNLRPELGNIFLCILLQDF